MKKIFLFLVVIALGVSFGLIRSENWYPQNVTVTSNTKMPILYGRTGFLVKNLGANAVNVVLNNNSVIATDNVQGYAWFDYYPNCWNGNVATDAFTLNAASGTVNAFVVTYELNE